MMKKISFLIFEQSFGAAIYPPLTLFQLANQFMIETTGKPAFEIELVGYEQRKIRLDAYTTIECDRTIDDDLSHDFIIIPGIDQLYAQNLDWGKYYKLSTWLVGQHRKGVEIGSLCLGTALLAQAGILDDNTCTTHWIGTTTINQQFPKVNLTPSETVVVHNGVYTSGGAFSSNQLILYLIEKWCGKHIAIYISKMVAIEYPIKSQNQFYIFQARKNHNDEPVAAAQGHMETNYHENINMKELSKQMNMSPRNFIRRFKKATGSTPIEYLQKVRVDVAKRLFEEGNSSVTNVMYSIGYQDIKSFGVLFKRMAGMTPSSYAKRFRVLDRA